MSKQLFQLWETNQDGDIWHCSSFNEGEVLEKRKELLFFPENNLTFKQFYVKIVPIYYGSDL